MVEQFEELAYRLRFVFVGSLMAASLLLLPYLLSQLSTASAAGMAGYSAEQNTNSTSVFNNPNVITGSLSNMGRDVNSTLGNVGDSLGSAFSNVASTVGSAATGTGRFVGGSLHAGATLTIEMVSGTVGMLARFNFGVIGLVANNSVVGSVIRPADGMTLPAIDTQAMTFAAEAKLPAIPEQARSSQPPATLDTHGAWPINGDITTLFGVPHWPYQPTHTGIDISSGHASGVTPVMPFRPGRVVETVRSGSGLGNYVVIDHGNGLTSVYAHLATISVRVGQDVTRQTPLGHEGSTGASTGTHLHLEIRQDGQAVDPRPYIGNHP